MDERIGKQIDLIASHEVDLAGRAVVACGREIYAEHSFKKILGSSVTIKKVVAGCEEVALGLLSTLLNKVGAVSKSTDAMDRISAAMEIHFETVEAEAMRAAKMGSRGMQKEPPPSIANATLAIVDRMKADVRTKIEIERFSFSEATPVEISGDPRAQGSESRPAKNRGGKPLAAHWDQMWASMSVALWSGDFDPKSQADVKRAMLEWFDDQGIEVSDTPVVERARALWLKIEAAR